MEWDLLAPPRMIRTRARNFGCQRDTTTKRRVAFRFEVVRCTSNGVERAFLKLPSSGRTGHSLDRRPCSQDVADAGANATSQSVYEKRYQVQEALVQQRASMASWPTRTGGGCG